MLSTVAVTVATHNLSDGVGMGALVAMVLFTRHGRLSGSLGAGH